MAFYVSQVYEGYVDDPRNTDNSWMETVALNFHDETGDSVGKFKLHAGMYIPTSMRQKIQRWPTKMAVNEPFRAKFGDENLKIFF